MCSSDLVEVRYKQGIVKEIKKLLEYGYSWDDPGLGSLGYIQWRAFLEGESTVSEVLKHWKCDEHSYARWQLTYFRKDEDIVWLDISKSSLLRRARERVDKWYYGEIGRAHV